MLLTVRVQQQYGFAVTVMSPRAVGVRGLSRIKLALSDIKVLASFSPVEVTRIASQNTITKRGGGYITGYFYPSDVVAPSGSYTCCRRTITVFALVSMTATGRGFFESFSGVVSADTTVRCRQYRCRSKFMAMSEFNACPRCVGPRR